MRSKPSDRAAAVVLAAGEAQRFGGQKLLMPLANSTVLGCVVASLEEAGLQPIIVVAGSDEPAIANALRDTRAQVLRNPDPSRGMVSSVRVGVSALPSARGRFLVALGDQPGLRPADLLYLLREHSRLGKGIAVPTHRGKRGHPVVFHGRYREKVMALRDHQTLRHLVHAHADDVAEVELACEAVLFDINTGEQYEQEVRRPRREQ